VSPRGPDFDELLGDDVTPEERDRFRRVHDLLVTAGPPPELSPELEAVQWPEEALAPLGLMRTPRARRKRSPLLIAAAIATVAAAAFLFGQATGTNSTNAIDVKRVVKLRGTQLARGAFATLELGGRDSQGNWPMILHVSGLKVLPAGGYYDLYLTREAKPVALCGSFNVVHGSVTVHLSAAYALERFDGWVVTRQIPPNHEPKDIVLRPTAAA
jgi:hypothetical protein